VEAPINDDSDDTGDADNADALNSFKISGFPLLTAFLFLSVGMILLKKKHTPNNESFFSNQ